MNDKVYYDESCYVCSLEINAVRKRGEACGIEFVDISDPNFNKQGDFESEMESMVEKVKSFIQKEYRKVTGSSVSLTKEGECDVLVQRLSNYRTFVQANLAYKIGGLNEVEEADPAASEDRLEDSIKKFLELGKGPKPKNVTRKDEQ